MEPYNLVLGIPGDDVPGRYFQVRKYALDGSFSTLMTVDQSGNCSVSGKVSASASSANTCAVFGQAINPTGAYGGLFQYGNDGNNAAYLGGNGAAAIFYGTVTANGTLTVNGTFNNYSDRNAKQDFAPVKPEEILEKVAHLPVTAWSYKTDAPTRHIGPMAQDFHAAFDVGTDEKHIAPMDEGGVALAAIQGLNAKVDYQAAQLRAKDAELQALKATVAELQQTVRRLAPTQK